MLRSKNASAVEHWTPNKCCLAKGPTIAQNYAFMPCLLSRVFNCATPNSPVCLQTPTPTLRRCDKKSIIDGHGRGNTERQAHEGTAPFVVAIPIQPNFRHEQAHTSGQHLFHMDFYTSAIKRAKSVCWRLAYTRHNPDNVCFFQTSPWKSCTPLPLGCLIR